MGSDDRRILAGAMSGTSADGIDIALARITGRGLSMSAELLHHHARPYPTTLKQSIFTLRGSGQTSLAELAHIGRSISLEYAAAVNAALAEANMKATDLAAVAAHGQTLYHAPPDTIQWLDPSLIAAEVGCPVVSDFRRADCAAGGQGAPLVPFADYILFRHPTKSRVLLNIGGIANLTYIPAGATIDQLIAFDTGPGNCVSDWLCRKYLPDGPGFDVDGAIASTGQGQGWSAMVRDEYFLKPPPKSTDGPAMIAEFQRAFDRFDGAALSLPDLLATACSVAAQKIAISFDYFLLRARKGPMETIVSGGGTRNGCLMRELRRMLEKPYRGGTVVDCVSLGATAESKEAMAFALLAAATLDGIPSNVPSCTGAKRAVVLGSVTPKP